MLHTYHSQKKLLKHTKKRKYFVHEYVYILFFQFEEIVYICNQYIKKLCFIIIQMVADPDILVVDV